MSLPGSPDQGIPSKSDPLPEPTPDDSPTAFVSWFPMVVIALVQIQMGFNVSALIISMGAIVEDLEASPTSVGTALVVYSLAVAGLVMLGAKFSSFIGPRLAFQIGIVVQGGSFVLMAVSRDTSMMIVAQGIAGIAAAVIVPVLVVLIAAHYRGAQQALTLGLLGAAQAVAGISAFLIVGFLTAFVSWRWSFVILVILSVANLILSFRLKTIARDPGVRFDLVGALLIGAAVVLISVGFDSVKAWGLIVAEPEAPFDVLGLSPALIFVVLGIVCGQWFFAWLRRRRIQGKSQIFALEVLDTREEVSATVALLVIGALGPAVNFLIPLYIQIVQGRSTLETAIAVIPYSLAILLGATFVVRLYGRLAPRNIGRYGFVAVAAGLFLLAYVIQNDWGTPMVILSLVIIGVSEGALLTLMFNVLVSASPKELAGYVGALRGTVSNLATGLGTATASVLAVVTLSTLVAASVAASPAIPPEIVDELEMDNVDFIGNDELEDALGNTSASREDVDEAVRINTEARLQSLKISFQVLAGLALLGIVPASSLPPYVPREVPRPRPENDSEAAGSGVVALRN